MTDHSLASDLSPEKHSSWNFDYLQRDDEEEEQSSNSNDFFSDLREKIMKNVYFNDELNQDLPKKKPIERSTVRVDSSDLISRCKTLLPLLTDANRNLLSKIQSGENVRIELDSDEDEINDQERTIEMNLMFCPTVDSSSSSDSDDDDDDEEQLEGQVFPLKKKSNPGHIVELPSNNQSEENAEK